MAKATDDRSDSGPSTCDFRQIALEELRETDQIKEQSLNLMIDWIRKHPHIKKCRTDAPFLLRFLRTKKFSVPLACEMLERFLTIRQLYPHWFQNLDCNDPELKKLLTDGYLVPLPQRDRGKIILFCSAKHFDAQKFTSCHMVRVHSLVTETLADDEFNQIAGYCYVNDESGLSLDHLALWSLTEIKNIMKCIQHSSPMRHKETHFLFLPSYSAKILEYAFAFLSDKLRSRIKIHPKLENLYDCLDKSILPAEYGGLIPIKDMIEQFQAKLAEKRSSVLALDDMYIELKNNQSKFLKDIQNELGTGVEGSFKKLEID